MISKNDIIQLIGSEKLYYVIKVIGDDLIVAYKTDNNIQVKVSQVANHWALQG